MFPRVKKIKNDKVNEVEVNFFTNNQGLELNKELCVGCGICTKVCPTKAILKPLTNGKVRIKTEDLIPEIPNPLKCSYCGTCVYMCPFSSLTLKKNNSIVELSDLEIVIKKVVPNLDYQLTKCKKIQRQAKVYMEGEIDLNYEKCITCLSCVDVCPTGAYSTTEIKEGEKKKRKVLLDSSQCIYCGTCVNSCSKDAIDLKINNIKYSGDYKEIFWSEVINRLKEET